MLTALELERTARIRLQELLARDWTLQAAALKRCFHEQDVVLEVALHKLEVHGGAELAEALAYQMGQLRKKMAATLEEEAVAELRSNATQEYLGLGEKKGVGGGKRASKAHAHNASQPPLSSSGGNGGLSCMGRRWRPCRSDYLRHLVCDEPLWWRVRSSNNRAARGSESRRRRRGGRSLVDEATEETKPQVETAAAAPSTARPLLVPDTESSGSSQATFDHLQSKLAGRLTGWSA